MNNLKKFNTEADYSAATLHYPAVSWVTSTDVVHFDKTAPTPSFSGLTVYYNITDISQPTNLFKYGGGSGSGSGSGSGGVLPSAMIIDGTAVEVTNSYQFPTTGEHIVNYSFADNTIPEGFLKEGSTVIKVEIGDAITTFDRSAFDACYSLTSCTIGSSVTSIGDYAFYYCGSLTSIVIPDSVRIIGGDAFSYCTSLTDVTIGNSVTNIGNTAFRDCRSLLSVTIPDSVTSIGDFAFFSCSGLTSVAIGNQITEIGELAFGECSGLVSITVEAVNPPQLWSEAFINTNDCPIYVPSASVETYKQSSGWSDYASRIQAIQ